MEMVKWSNFVPPEYAPVAYGLGAAAAGGGLGWLYDWLKGKKHTARRVGLGALIGGLGGLGYGQKLLSDHVKGIVDNKAKDIEDEKSKALREVASGLGIKTDGKSSDDIKSDIKYVLSKSEDVPDLMDRGTFGAMLSEDVNRIEGKHLIEMRKFLERLKGKKVIPLDVDGRIPREVDPWEGTYEAKRQNQRDYLDARRKAGEEYMRQIGL